MFAWVITMFKAIGNLSEYNDARNSSGISAPQISQISGEYVVSVLPWLAGSLGVPPFCEAGVVVRFYATAEAA